jgi:long-subunit fatty acid transport protein
MIAIPNFCSYNVSAFQEDMKLCKIIALLFAALFVTSPVFCQQLQPVPTFRLVNTGYGAAALGIGGAFVAIADDLSTIYWNPAGLAQLPETQGYVDYRIMGDSDDDFAPEVEANRFQSEQRFSVSGNQLHALAISWAFPGKKTSWVPAFAYQRLSTLPPKRELKEQAGLVEFSDPQNLVFFESTGIFNEDFKGGEEEFTFGIGVLFSQKFKIGGTWSFLRGRPQEVLTGTFHDTFFLGRDQPSFTFDYQLEQTYQEDTSGNYFRFGALYSPHPLLNVGGAITLPYTRKSDITLARSGTVTEGGVSRPLQEGATAESEIDIPFEWSLGASLRPRPTFRVAGSITHADWTEALRIIGNSSNTQLIPVTIIPFPTDRPGTLPQRSLLQLRGGLEYILGEPGNGFVLRSGIFRDEQPWGNLSGESIDLDGYTFGAGYVTQSFRIDVAFVREKGDVTFTQNSRGNSHYSNRRWVLSFGIGS